MSESTAILILAGGAGTRLWPLSTDAVPKQFLRIFDGESLIEKTFARLSQLAPAARMFLSTNERYASLVREQLPGIPPQNILVEPARRNTAPAIATCCAAIADVIPDATIAIFPSDHAIGDEPAFVSIVRRAMEFAGAHDELVTIGIQPTEPNTGFGYLEMGDEVATGVRRVARFVEKPTLELAGEFLASGRYAWNGGMFVWRYDVFRRALQKCAPELLQLAERLATADPGERRALYEQLPSISIDYAVMEKAPNVVSVPGEFEWSDVGSWSAVARLTQGRAERVFAEKSSGVFVLSDSSKPIAIIGFDRAGVIESPDGLLVLNLDEAEALAGVVKKIMPGA
jgi:mannose-1-phosphate guanylyltransferase